MCLRIEVAHGAGKGCGIAALVMRGRADDRIECRRKYFCYLLGLLVEGDSKDENPGVFAINLFERGKRLPDPVGRVADINDRQRIPSDGFETARPARLAQPRSHGCLDAGSGIVRPCALQPAQEQGRCNRGVVELETARQGHAQGAEVMIAKREVEALPGYGDGFAADPDFIANEQAFDSPVTVIFENVGSQVAAVLAIDNDATGGAGVALVGYDQFQRMAEQFDMLVVDRSDRGDAAAQQTNGVVASANA